jgi:hypothetical protein
MTSDDYDWVGHWVVQFWYWKDRYEFSKTRSVLGTEQASRGMREAVEELHRLDALKLHRHLPTVEQYRRRPEWYGGKPRQEKPTDGQENDPPS